LRAGCARAGQGDQPHVVNERSVTATGPGHGRFAQREPVPTPRSDDQDGALGPDRIGGGRKRRVDAIPGKNGRFVRAVEFGPAGPNGEARFVVLSECCGDVLVNIIQQTTAGGAVIKLQEIDPNHGGDAFAPRAPNFEPFVVQGDPAGDLGRGHEGLASHPDRWCFK
jgi:hypothetical protein